MPGGGKEKGNEANLEEDRGKKLGGRRQRERETSFEQYSDLTFAGFNM